MLRTGPHGAKTGIGLNITNLFDPDAVFPSMRSRGYATAIFGKIHNALCTPKALYLGMAKHRALMGSRHARDGARMELGGSRLL